MSGLGVFVRCLDVYFQGKNPLNNLGLAAYRRLVKKSSAGFVTLPVLVAKCRATGAKFFARTENPKPILLLYWVWTVEWHNGERVGVFSFRTTNDNIYEMEA